MPTRRTLVLGLAGVAAAPAFADLALLQKSFAQGGAALIVRHAQTEAGIGDPPGYRLDDCSTQRNLSEAGRAQARRAGERLAAAGVRIDELRSSRWCRCIDTARLLLPGREVQVLDALVTHQVNIGALTGQGVGMGEMVVVRPEGCCSLKVVGRIRIP